MSTHVGPHIAGIVGANLRRGRDAKGWTQRQVAERVGVEGKDISRWETGSVEPGPKYRQALASVLFGGDLSALYRTAHEESVPA